MPDAHNIAILLPNWVGDVVMATPALGALRSHYSGSRITHVGRGTAIELLDGADLCDETLVDISLSPPRVVNFLRQTRRIAKRNFGLAVLFPNSFRAGFLCWAGGVKRIAGYDRDGRGWMLTDRLPPPRNDDGSFTPIPTIDYYNALASMLGAQEIGREMRLAATQDGSARADGLLQAAEVDPSRPVVMLNPGASYGPSKLWAAERYAAVADALIERRSAQVIINAAPSERSIAARVAAAMNREPKLNLAENENSLSLLKGLMRTTSLLITNDTGARHVAAAMGAGVVTIFGSTDPAWARIDYPRERIVRADVPCAPCQKKRCPNPPGETFGQCMTAVSVDMVLEAADELLDEAFVRSPEDAR